MNIFNIYPKRRGEAVTYERLTQSEVRLYTEICKFKPCIRTISKPHYLLFYSADCKYTAVIRQRLEMPHFSIVTKMFITQRLTRGKSVVRLFDILGGIHSKLESYGFHKQNFDYCTINKAKRNVSMSDINV